MAWVSSIFSALFRPPRNVWASISSCEENICSLSTEMDELKSRRMEIQQRVDVAEREGQARTNQVEWWLGRVEALEKDAMAVDAAYQQSFCRCLGGLYFDAWSIYLLSVKAAAKKAEAVELKGRGDFCQVAYDLIPVRFVAVPNTPTVGMESNLEKLTRHVGDDEVPIIGIHGMGGVGKTALLKRFHNEFLVGETDLDLVIMIEVSNPFDEEDVQRVLGARLGLQWVATRTVEERAVILFNVLQKRKFVLIIDDLWKDIDLEMVGVPIPAAGSKSKIIVASRVESVCNLMDAKKMIRVECLRWEEAWELFLGKAGSGAELIHSHPGINKHAKVIANKCGGLPLALITIARASASNKTIEEWEYDAAILDREPVTNRAESISRPPRPPPLPPPLTNRGESIVRPPRPLPPPLTNRGESIVRPPRPPPPLPLDRKKQPLEASAMVAPPEPSSRLRPVWFGKSGRNSEADAKPRLKPLHWDKD